jgi:NAD(P)-dependent dehydrogenase (short-subunit alcohol dehydrogenase family)
MSFDSLTLSGKKILITGAGKGIGRHCALACSALDAEVIAVSRTESDLQSLFEESDHRITPWVNDVMSTELLRRIRDLDQLDGLINNAGTNRVGAMVDLDDEDIDAVIDLNVRAAFRVAQASILPMKNSGGGAVVNMSSQMGHVGSPERTLYCMSKHAIEGLTRAMAVELATDGIRVNSVAPTFVLTSLTAPMFDDQAFSDFVMDMIPMRKLATEEEVANACVYLLSDLSGSTTGTCLKVDGGWTAR